MKVRASCTGYAVSSFCRSGAHGDPPRTVLFEDFVKIPVRNKAMQRFMFNFSEDLRHRPVSVVGGLQHLEDFVKGLWAAADQQLLFGISNPMDLKRGKRELYRMRAWQFGEMSAHVMSRGRAWVFSRRGNIPELASGLLIDIRPTLICAGGRTMNAGDL